MKKILLGLLAASLFSSCYNIKKIERSYQLFQNGLDSLGSFNYKELTVKEGDNLTIQVYTLASPNQEQVSLFNLSGGGGGRSGNYIVNNLGEIDLPKIGRTLVSGLTCSQIKQKLKTEWSKYIKDIGVDVQMLGFTVNVLGEVKGPGIKTFKSERATIIDVIAAAGGLADEGKREDVLLIREDSSKRKAYRVDLRDANLYKSPVFQLQQNDLIYVGASKMKFKTIGNTNLQQTITPITVIASLASFAINAIALIIAITRK